MYVFPLDKFGYTCTFVNRKVNIGYEDNIIGIGHISQKRIDRLIIEGVLQPFDVRDIEKCVSCIKGKNTRTSGMGSSRAKKLLQLIHKDTCGPFPTATRNGHPTSLHSLMTT